MQILSLFGSHVCVRVTWFLCVWSRSQFLWVAGGSCYGGWRIIKQWDWSAQPGMPISRRNLLHMMRDNESAPAAQLGSYLVTGSFLYTVFHIWRPAPLVVGVFLSWMPQQRPVKHYLQPDTCWTLKLATKQRKVCISSIICHSRSNVCFSLAYCHLKNCCRY